MTSRQDNATDSMTPLRHRDDFCRLVELIRAFRRAEVRYIVMFANIRLVDGVYMSSSLCKGDLQNAEIPWSTCHARELNAFSLFFILTVSLFVRHQETFNI
jgi:hypothetical protein